MQIDDCGWCGMPGHLCEIHSTAFEVRCASVCSSAGSFDTAQEAIERWNKASARASKTVGKTPSELRSQRIPMTLREAKPCGDPAYTEAVGYASGRQMETMQELQTRLKLSSESFMKLLVSWQRILGCPSHFRGNIKKMDEVVPEQIANFAVFCESRMEGDMMARFRLDDKSYELLEAILFWVSVLSILAFVVSGGIATWGKPYNPMIVTYVPWYSWVLLVVGFGSYVGNVFLVTRRGG